MLALAHTIAYDLAVTGAHERGGTIPLEPAEAVRPSTLVLVGGATPDWMLSATRQVADALPAGRYEALDAQTHIVPPEVLRPVLCQFLPA
ncbi:hypothetical protein [Actinomadura macra]|uniref:hypothetical protein n=1 Tax=Actinomadura macra TaxID=46164 RepID=UPI000AAC47C9|nr:hypothetical protein [Actinomadura macra]